MGDTVERFTSKVTIKYKDLVFKQGDRDVHSEPARCRGSANSNEIKI